MRTLEEEIDRLKFQEDPARYAKERFIDPPDSLSLIRFGIAQHKANGRSALHLPKVRTRDGRPTKMKLLRIIQADELAGVALRLYRNVTPDPPGIRPVQFDVIEAEIVFSNIKQPLICFLSALFAPVYSNRRVGGNDPMVVEQILRPNNIQILKPREGLYSRLLEMSEHKTESKDVFAGVLAASDEDLNLLLEAGYELRDLRTVSLASFLTEIAGMDAQGL